MSKPLFNKGFSGLGQLGILVCFIGVGMVLASFLAMGAWLALTGQPVANMPTDMLKPQYGGAVKAVQAISTLFAFFLPAVAYAFVCFRNGWQALGFGHKMAGQLLLLSLAIIVCSGPLIDAVTTLNKSIPLSAGARSFFDKMEKAYEDQIKVIAEVKTIPQCLQSLLLIALLPAVFEEVLFRGGLQQLLQRWWQKPLLALLVTSIVFSAVHGSWYGFLPRIVLGLVLGGIFYTTKNIWYCIVVHFVNNAVVVSYMYYLTLRGQSVSLATDVSFPWWMAIFSAGALYLLFGRLKKKSEQQVPREIFYEPNNPFDERNHLA
jgi:uncharacterized protein